MKTICGLDCNTCAMKSSCAGCSETNGRPFGGSCMIAECCSQKEGAERDCRVWSETTCTCRLKKQLIDEYNALGIADMDEVTELYALRGAFVNLEYVLPGGNTVRFWDDNRIYLGNQLPKKGSSRYYGLTADEHYLLVCEYGENGSDPKIVIFRKRRQASDDK